MKKIKWGILGPGNIARQFAYDFAYVKNAELKAVASRSEKRATSFAEEFKIPTVYNNYEDLYSDPEIDAIYIATPHNYHFEQSAAALKAGKAVLCEKPITINPNQIQELIQLSKSTGNYLMEGLWTYFLPAIRKSVDWIEQGQIGNILYVKSDFGFHMNYDPQGRLYNPNLAGGAMFDLGIYTLAMAWLYTKQNPKSLTVIGNKAPTGVDDSVIHLFQYADKVASLHCSFRCKLPNYTYVIGEKGFIEIPDFWKAKECRLYKDDKIIEHYADTRTSFGFNYEIESVSQNLLEGRKESEIMPLSWSLTLQEHLKLVLDKV